MDIPYDFRCPISMELIQDPVTILTGVTYERKNIERWFNKYKGMTCPATMQPIQDFNLTPNDNLKRLISVWNNDKPQTSSPPRPSPSIDHAELVKLLEAIESTPFKVSSLKKLRSMVDLDSEKLALKLRKSRGVEVLLKIVVEISEESSDFVAFRACEEAIGVLHVVISSHEGLHEKMQLFMKPEVMKSMAIMLQRASSEARSHTILILQKMAKGDFDWNLVIQDQSIDFSKSMLDIVSDEMCRKSSSGALEVLIDIMNSSKKSRLKAIEMGAICILVELLADSNKSKSEKIMHLIKILCESADGRLALTEHGLGIAIISNKISNILDGATKIGVKILWLIVCNSHPSDRVLDEMLLYGAVKKMVALLHIDGRSSTKDRAVKILKHHSGSWRRYPCFPNDLKDYLGLGLMGDSS